ncbi:hypothetical protein AB0I28_19680 [Phytomonospora sp. NPDC050363]|uniref:hypothetical protein n=1 Tax=Phytomonospora sp. NPDC050363 TaxID=3155642 RepID=UPI00340D1CDC
MANYNSPADAGGLLHRHDEDVAGRAGLVDDLVAGRDDDARLAVDDGLADADGLLSGTNKPSAVTNSSTGALVDMATPPSTAAAPPARARPTVERRENVSGNAATDVSE